MQPNNSGALARALSHHNRCLGHRLHALHMTVRLAKTIKALSELLVVGFAIYGVAIGAVGFTPALVVAAGVVGGAEALEAVLAAQGADAIATQEDLEALRDELAEQDSADE